jgi:7-cyano-7-deazaguanine reductase
MKISDKTVRKWSDRSLLKALPNPSSSGYEIKIKCPEVTFEGVKGQPDFAELYITFFPDNSIVELKSMKEYFYQFRNKILSYERLLNVIYEDMMETYSPTRLRLVMICNARGGISSKLTVDSDWGVRGGKESFKDWVGQEDIW